MDLGWIYQVPVCARSWRDTCALDSQQSISGERIFRPGIGVRLWVQWPTCHPIAHLLPRGQVVCMCQATCVLGGRPSPQGIPRRGRSTTVLRKLGKALFTKNVPNRHQGNCPIPMRASSPGSESKEKRLVVPCKEGSTFWIPTWRGLALLSQSCPGPGSAMGKV